MISKPPTSWAPCPRLKASPRSGPRPPPEPAPTFLVLRQPTPTDEEGIMITRRLILAGTAALAFAGSASAEDWKAKYPELTFAVVPAENASGVTERWTPFVEYLSKQLGVKVTLRIANDYA